MEDLEKILEKSSNWDSDKCFDHNQGPTLVIGAAGNGKTEAITTCIYNFISKNYVDPYNIVALTFNNNEAYKMKKNIENICTERKNKEKKNNDTLKNLKNLFVGTFHNYCLEILKEERKFINNCCNGDLFSILDDLDSKNIISNIIEKMKLDKNVYLPNEILSKITKLKNEIITADEYKKNTDNIESDKQKHIEHFVDIYLQYEKICKKINAMDFDDILLNTYDILLKNKSIREKYQDRFKYIFIDEFQDTSKIQYEIIKVIADKYKHIYVFGNDDQRIYDFKGTVTDNILRFYEDYKNCKILTLKQNYRSTNTIVRAANSVIKNNDNRITKNDIFTNNKEGDKIHVIESLTSSEEASTIASSILSLIKANKLKKSDIAILYRKNSQAFLLEEALCKVGINCKVFGKILFYRKKIVKDFLSYLKVIVNTKDDESIKRSINEPRRGLGGVTLEKIYDIADKSELGLWDVFNNHVNLLPQKAVNLVLDYVSIIKNGIDNLHIKNAYEIANYICKTTNFLGKIRKKTDKKSEEEYNDIVEFLDIIKIFVNDNKGGDNSLSSFLLYLQSNIDNDFYKCTDSVCLLTIHRSKGFEFKCVYIVGLQEGILPLLSNNKIDNKLEIESERRLFYVGITRAKKNLFLSFAKNVNIDGFCEVVKKSRFLNEIDNTCLYEGTLSKDTIENPLTKIVGGLGSKYSIFKYSIVKRKSKNQNKNSDCKKNTFEVGSHYFHTNYGDGIITHIDKKRGIATCFFSSYSTSKKIIYKFEESEVCV